MRKLAVTKSEQLQAAGNTKRCSSAMALTITSGCSWNMDSFPSRILTLVFMSQKVGINFVLTKRIHTVLFSTPPPPIWGCGFFKF